MKRTPLRKVSKKQSARIRKYYNIRNAWFPKHFVCEICEKTMATDVHHRKGRRGNLLFDTAWWMALCRTCHTVVHNDVKNAKKMGWLVPF